MAQEKGYDLQAYQSTAGGSNLGQHWRGEKDLESRKIIKQGNFDAIIIQDHSRRALDDPDSLLIFGKKFVELIKENDARPYVYMTWARVWDPYMQAPIKKMYRELGNETGATVAPVGLAWERARQLRPDLILFDPDGSHPSPTGTYLSACVFFGVLTGDSPVGLPSRIITTDKDGEKLYLNIQSNEDALFCQKVAQEILEQAKK
jgi:hypothetical protein